MFPILLYGCEAVDISTRDLVSLDFSFVRVVMKIFKCSNNIIINEVMVNLGISRPSDLIRVRTERFNIKYANSDNSLCQSLFLLT